MQKTFKASIWEFAESVRCTWGWALERQWGEKAEVGGGHSALEACEKNTHKLIHQRFKSISKHSWKKFLYQWVRGSSYEKEQVERSGERRGNNQEKKTSNLQIKKQSNQSCGRALIPGRSFQAAAEWNGTRLEYANLFVDGWEEVEGVMEAVGGSEKINGHSRGRHWGPLKVYCHKH